MGKEKRKRSREDSPGPSSGSSSSSSSDDERRAKKHKKDKEKSKKHKKDKKEKKGDDNALVKQAKAFLKAQLGGGAAGEGAGPSAPLPPPTLKEELRISSDDYFLKSAEFTAWLQEERRLFFNELTTEQSHALFEQFVALWNAERLPQKYYASQVAAPVKRTSYTWAFNKGSAGGMSSGTQGYAAFLDDQKQKQGEARVLEQQEKRKWRSEQKELLDELLPKATGREAQVEKRIARREEARARETSPDAVRLPGGGDVYGGDDSIEAAKAREARRAEGLRQRQLLKQEEVAAKTAAFQAKEDEKMQAFRALLQKGPITIAKRQ